MREFKNVINKIIIIRKMVYLLKIHSLIINEVKISAIKLINIHNKININKLFYY